MDKDDILQAVEIAIGDRLGHEIDQPRAVSGGHVRAFAQRLRRVLAELPPEVTVQEILEAMDAKS